MPWPWAYTWPIARLMLPFKEIELIVLNGAYGRSLAFGPRLRRIQRTARFGRHNDLHRAP
jgi:hypothetical protein